MNQYIDHKANKLGVSISERNVPETTDNEGFTVPACIEYSFYYKGVQCLSYSARELEEQLDDLLDPSFRQAEAAADRKFVDMAYGPQDDIE